MKEKNGKTKGNFSRRCGCDGELEDDFGERLNQIANLEAGTDINIHGDALVNEAQINNEFGLDEGVTDYAPYEDMADYRMVTPGYEDDEPFNNQGS